MMIFKKAIELFRKTAKYNKQIKKFLSLRQPLLLTHVSLINNVGIFILSLLLLPDCDQNKHFIRLCQKNMHKIFIKSALMFVMPEL